jgi:hypothetical protein
MAARHVGGEIAMRLTCGIQHKTSGLFWQRVPVVCHKSWVRSLRLVMLA